MALTKISGNVIKDSVSLAGNVSIGGTLTYQDVTNIDAVGLITARTGIKVLGGGIDVLDGRVKIGTTSNTPASANEPGIVFGDNTAGTATKGIASFCANGAAPLLLTRRVSDGNVLGIADDTTTRGMLRVTSNDLEITAIEELRLSTGAGHNEKIRLTNAGRFGLGVTGPDAMLHVKGSDNVLGVFESTDADSLIQFKDNSTSDTILMGALGGDDLLLRCDAGNIVFHVANNNEKLRIDSSGRLLLGTTTEGSGGADELTIATSGDTGMTIRSGTSSAGGIYFSDGTSGADEYRGVISYNHASNYMRFYTDSTERARIDSTGRISAGKHGVGTYNDAAEWFKIQSNDTAANLSIIGSNDTHSTLNLGDEDDFNIQKIKSDHTNNSLQFFTNNTERLRITQDGSAARMGLGIVPQASQYSGWTILQIGESAALTSNRTTGDTNQTELSNNAYLNSTASHYKRHHNDEASRYVQAHGRHAWYTAASGSADTNISFTEVMKVDASGYVTKPQTPAFFATHTGGNSSLIGTLYYNNGGSGYYNNGGHLNLSTGKFTVPVDGIYHFHFHGFLQTNQGNGDYEVSMQRENSGGGGGTTLTRTYGYRDQATNQYGPSVSMQCTTYLTSGQTVKIVVGGLSYHAANGYYFGGYLLG
tara:strand:+ start:1316 stop:3259 length:1944 start_codon:yes stop_codon:yes gene_type:complete